MGVNKPRLNIGDQSWRMSEELRRIEEELSHLMQGPEPLYEAIAVNHGLADGDKGRPNTHLLSSEFHANYIKGYANGAWWRYAREERFGKTKDELFELIYMPRYPHDPPVWYA